MITGKEFAEKLIGNKKLMILLLLGVALVFASGLMKKTEPLPEKKESEKSITYVDERKLADMLSNVEGAGRVQVYVTYNDAGEKIIAYDKRKDEESVANVGKENEPYVVKTKYPEIKGVLVIAEGASNETVKNRLLKCVKSITDVPYGNICVEVKKK